MAEKASFAKTQHYVPQFLLKNFTVAEKEQLFVFDKREGRAFRANVRKIAAENGLYDIKLPQGTVSAEAVLSSLEGAAARIIANLLREQNVRVMNDDDKVVMALFIGVQMLRVPHRIEFTFQVTELMRKQWGNFPGMPSQEESMEDARQAMVNNLNIAVDLLPDLLNKAWLLFRAHNKTDFYVSDNPVTMHNIRKNPFRGSFGVAVRGIEIYLPISVDTTLALYCKSHEEGWHRTMAQQEILQSLGVRVPSEFAAQEALFGVLAEGITKGNAIQLTEKVTNFQNELQIWNSGRFIFSKTGDFEPVKESIKRSPTLKRGPQLAGT